jgi:guanylate kinase
MTARGVILYGPPTAGKDTTTAALTKLDPRFALLTKLKVGTGRMAGYTLITPGRLDQLRAAGRILVETHRYGNVYAIDRHGLDQMTEAGLIPLVHIGNLADLRRLSAQAPGLWLRVLLWVPREVCAQRSRQRGDTDTPIRLQAWEETLADLRADDTGDAFELSVRTDEHTPEDVAHQIAAACDALGHIANDAPPRC